MHLLPLPHPIGSAERAAAKLILPLRRFGHSDHDIATTLVSAGAGVARGMPNHVAFAAYLAEMGKALRVDTGTKGD